MIETETQSSRSLQRMVRQLREDISKLSESQTFMRRVVAVLVENAGGEIAVDELAMAKGNRDPTIITWHSPEDMKLHIKVRTELSNE